MMMTKRVPNYSISYVGSGTVQYHFFDSVGLKLSFALALIQSSYYNGDISPIVFIPGWRGGGRFGGWSEGGRVDGT